MRAHSSWLFVGRDLPVLPLASEFAILWPDILWLACALLLSSFLKDGTGDLRIAPLSSCVPDVLPTFRKIKMATPAF